MLCVRSPAGLTSKGELDREQHTSSLPTPVRKRGVITEAAVQASRGSDLLTKP